MTSLVSGACLLTHLLDEVARGVGVVVGLQGVEDERCVFPAVGLHDFGGLSLQVLLQTSQLLLEECPLTAAPARCLCDVIKGDVREREIIGYQRPVNHGRYNKVT